MAFYTEQQIRDRAVQRGAITAAAASGVLRKSAGTGRRSFDVFLSHAYLDAQLILGVKDLIESSGLSVYVDWIDDPGLDRNRVTTATAAQLRLRMQQSNSLVYATSRASVDSKWMPWELGYFDGLRNSDKIAIFPLVPNSDSRFHGQEYLGLYPLVEQLRRVSDMVRRPTVVRAVGSSGLETKTLASFVAGGTYSSTGYYR